MTDKEIKKGFELIDKLREAYNAYYDTTKGMPYDIDVTLRESAFCLENLLNENNRQKAEIERLNGCVKSEDEVRTIAETVIQSRINTIRTETVKDFMKMLTKVWGHYPLNFMTSVDAFYSTVKQIAREMVGEDK